MRKCKNCMHSRGIFTLGSYSWFCEKKQTWIPWQIDSWFCRHYMARTFEAIVQMWSEEINKTVEKAIAELKGGGGDEV